MESHPAAVADMGGRAVTTTAAPVTSIITASLGRGRRLRRLMLLHLAMSTDAGLIIHEHLFQCKLCLLNFEQLFFYSEVFSAIVQTRSFAPQ